jgi:uncharacterized delta-60 repeat protein
MQKLTSLGLKNLVRIGCAILLASQLVDAAWAQDTFGTAQVIYGDSGSVSVDNSFFTPDAGAPTIAGLTPQYTAWFQWSTTNSGEVEFDTIGSVDDFEGVYQLDTVMGVYTGNSLTTLNLLAANDDLYPNVQLNASCQNFYTFGDTNYDASIVAPPSRPQQKFGIINQPFSSAYTGPSGLRFNAVAGKIYYIAVDTRNFPGFISLNWSLHPSGVLRFATENSDLNGLTYADGTTPMLLYQAAATESVGVTTTGSDAIRYTSFNNANGVLVTVTRVAGSTGKVSVDYTTVDLSTNPAMMGTDTFLTNGDLPAVAGVDYVAQSGTLTFDDNEMSKTILIPVINYDPVNARGIPVPRPNRDFGIQLIDDGGATSPLVDSAESVAVPPPRVDPMFSTAVVRILDVNSDPRAITSRLDTNAVPPSRTYTTIATNSVFNFQKANYRVYRAGANKTFTIYVNRRGTNASAASINYTVNGFYPFGGKSSAIEDKNYTFPLTPGSDYATPNPAGSVGGAFGVTSDFTFPSGYSGTLSWAADDFQPKPITFNILDNGLQQFNEDFQVDLYDLDSNGNPLQVGMVAQTTVTILNASDLDNDGGTSNINPPAGAVDELYNADYGADFWLNTVPPNMAHPGTDGEVYGLALQPDGNTVVVGDFFTYDQTGRNCIARATSSGYLDSTFDPGDGANGFISCVTLTTNNEILIGGNFTSFNGSLRNYIALLNSSGGLDTTFNPGQGFNGPVYALAQQPNGQVLVGGDFTQYNGVTRNHLALLNLDGTLDGTFNPGTNLNAAVSAIGLQPNGQVVVGGIFTNVAGIKGQSYATRLNADGSLDTTFDPASGPNEAVYAIGIQPDGKIVLGGNFTQVNGSSYNGIVRLTSTGQLDPNFYCGIGLDGPVYHLNISTNPIYSTTNSSVVVQTNFTIYVGGEFSVYNGTHRLGFARLNADGTLDTTFLDTAYNQFAGLTREYFGDPVGSVQASAIQSNGDVLIGGSFEQVGGGQFESRVRPNSFVNAFISTISRSAIRNHSNIARLHGGATPGPGNVGLNYTSYSVNKSAASMFVSLVRTNGNLGPAAANFSINPGLAQSGVDYFYAGDYNGASPLYWTEWEYVGPTRMHSDALLGQNAVPFDTATGQSFSGVPWPAVNVTIAGSPNSFNDLNAQFQMANPVKDQFYLGGEDIPLGVALGESSAPLKIIEDRHQSGTFGFASPSYTGTGLAAPIALTRTNGTYGVVAVSYTTTTNGSTAVAGADYRATSGSVSFQPTDTNKTFNVTILNSNYVSSVEKTVNLLLTGINPPVNGIASLGTTNAVLRIINPNFQGYLNLDTNTYAANLSAGFVSITVTRTVGSKGTLTLMCATTNNSAVSGIDFVGFTNLLTWNNGDVAPKTINIPLLNNGLVGTNRQFGVVIYNPTNGVTLTPSLFAANGTTNAIVTINNDNSYGTFQFAAPSYVVNENGGDSTITVFRNGATNGTASIQFATADATAFAGTNYVATNGTLNFAAGQLAASFKVQILDDGVTNPPPGSFYFTVALSTTNLGVVLGTPSVVNNYIVDDASFNRPPGSTDSAFDLGAGMNGDVLALALQSTGKIIAGGTFTTVNGVPENYLARLNVDGSADTTGFLSGLAGGNGNVYALANQTDDQLLVAGAFTSFNGLVRNRITRLNTDGSTDSSFKPGAGADNTIYSLAETFVGGVRKIYIGGAFSTIGGISHPNLARLNNDGTVDGGFAPGTGPTAPVYAVATYPTNSFYAGKLLVGGAFTNLNSFAVSGIARLNSDGSLDTNFDLNLNTSGAVRAIAIQSDNRILLGGDFTNVNGVAVNHLARLNSDGSLDTNFVANIGAGVNGQVNGIAVQLDGRIVVVGQFSLANGVTRNGITRLLPTGAVDPTINFGDGANGAVDAVVVQPNDQMIVIGGAFTQYNDQPAGRITRIYGGSQTGSGAFEFTSPTYQVDENGIQALIGIRRTGGTSGTNADGSGSVAVNFSTSDGTATNGINYRGVNQSVSFPAGEVLKTIAVPVMDDSNITANLTVNLALSSPTAPAIIGDQPVAVLTIINDDNAVSFTSDNYSVAKNILTGFGTVHVTRIGSISGSCSVSYLTTTNGTAVSGTDYYPTNGTVTFNPGDTDKIIYVPIINNNIPEGNRTVGLALSNNIGALMYAPSNTVLTIVDTVISPGLLSFSATNYTAGSGDGSTTITVLRTNGTSGSISVAFSTQPGTALPGIDYTPVSGTLTFNDGDTSKTFDVPVLNNPVAQAPVTLSVLLANPGGGATLVAPTNATLTILNTNIGFAFVSATNYFRETNGNALISVRRVGSTNGSAQVDYSTTPGTAQPGVNYNSISNTLTFGDGEAVKFIALPLIYDPQVTGDLLLNLSLSNPGAGSSLASPSNSLVVLQDADAGLSFTNSAMSVLKNAGQAVITVICTNPVVEPPVANTNLAPMSVQYATQDGTAVAGVDYQATSGTLLFTNGNGTNTFNVIINNNSLVTGDHNFTVRLFNATAPGQVVAPSNQVVTIVDNNSGLSFSRPVYTVLKSSAYATITVLRTDFTNAVTSVDYATADGTASAGVDYLATRGTLVFTNGETSKTFSVTNLSNPTVQPDKTVQLQLSNPTNGFLIAPYAATLTIHDTSGSLVVAAGSAFAPGGDPNNNGIIDTNETVSLLLALRASGGTNVNNLSATLLSANGVSVTNSPNSPTQFYGTLTVNGPSVSRPFTFTAAGTNGQQILLTLQLSNGVTNLGTASFTYTLGTWTTTFYNTNIIVINDALGPNKPTIAAPYPSIIVVSNVGGVVIKSVVTLSNLYHGFTKDIQALVVSPAAQDTLIMAHAGNGGAAKITLTFDDAAAASLSSTNLLQTGTNKPMAYTPLTIFP